MLESDRKSAALLCLWGLELLLWGGERVEGGWLITREFLQAGREGCTAGIEGTKRRGSWGRQLGL